MYFKKVNYITTENTLELSQKQRCYAIQDMLLIRRDNILFNKAVAALVIVRGKRMSFFP